MRYTLGVSGGPSKLKSGTITFELDIQDRQVATIDAYDEITAHEVGDTTLVYRIVHTRKEDE